MDVDAGKINDDSLEDISDEDELEGEEAEFSSDDDDSDNDDDEDDGDDDDDEEDDGAEEGDDNDDESVDDDDDDDGDNDEDWETEDEDALLEASDSEGGEETEKCPICLNRFREQDIGTPEACDHLFCLECIQEWAKNVNTCPVDRQVFRLILCKHSGDDKIFKRIPVEDRNTQAEDDDEPTYCEVCHQCDREDRLLLCDGCDQGYHLDCLTPPLSEVPVEEWFCPECGDREGWAEEADDYDEMQQISAENEMNIPRRPRRQIPRTIVAERVRSAIEEIRVMRTRRIRRIVSSEEEEEEEETPPLPPPAPSTSSTTRSPAAKKKTTRRKTPRKYKKRKTTRKRKTKTTRKRKTKKRKTTKTKTTTKTKRKGVKRKTRRKKRKVKKKVRTARPQPVTTVKSRIADSLGLCTPPKGTTIPLQKQRQERPLDAGADSLSIFGTRDELIGFHDEAASPGPAEARKPSKYSRLARSSYKPIGRVPVVKPASKPKGKVVETTAAAATSSAGPVDLLGSILQGQDKLHLHSKDITIQKDGSLLEKPKETFKSKAKPKISFSIGKSSPIKTPGSLFKTSPRVISPPTSVPKFDLNSKKGSEKTDKPSLPASSGSIGFQPSVCLNEEYDPAHPTDELDEAGATVVETKMVQDDDKYDPFHPTDELESDDDDKVVSDSQDDKNSALVDLKNKNHSKTSFSLNKTSQDDVTIQSAGGNYLHKDRLDVKNVFNEDDDDDEEFEAVSPEKDGDFDEAVNGKTVVVDDDDKSTDLEDEIEFPTNSDKVILINQEANNTSDKNKQDSGSDSHNTKHSSMSEKADTLKADSVVSYEKERRNEKEQNKTNKTPEKSMEFVKLSENKEIKEEKSVVPPKPGFHGGLPQVLLPQQLKVVAKANEKDKNKDVKNESSDVTKTDYTSKTDSKVKKAELPQKVAPIQMSLNVKKPQFRNRLLYGEIDFTEDVSYSESGFPQKFEVNMKRIEDAFKDTKLAEEKKDDVEIIEEIPKEKSSPLSDAQLKEDLTIEIKDESETAEDTERVEETVLDVKKGKAKKQTDIPVEYIKKVKDKKEKEIHVEYIKIVKDKKDPGKVDKKSNKDRKDDKKYDDTEEIGKKSKSKNRKDKSETTSKTEKENKSKKKSKRKVSIDDDDDVQEDEDELSYRKELKEIKEPKERKRNKDSKRHVKSDFSDEEEHQKGEKSKRSSDESKKSRQDKRKVREDIHDKKRVREDSYDRRKSREDSPDRRKTRDDSYDRRKSREDSYERRKSREDSHDRRKSREDSYERRKSREDSYDRKKHREYSYDRRKSREDKHDRKISREEDGYDYSDSLKTVDSHRKLSEDSKKMLVEYLQLSDDVKLKKDKRKKPSDEIKKSEEKHRGKGNEKNKTKDKHKKTNSEKLKLSNDYESISEDEILSDIDDKHEHWSEIEEGELQDDYWLKEKRKKDKRERKRNGDDRENRTMFYEETEDGEILYSDKAKLIKAEQEIDTRIVIQVSQNTENRRVWEEDEKRKKKRKKELKEKEEKRKERNKENEFKRDKKSSRHHRSRSRSKDHRRRSRSRERNKRSRSRSHDRPKKKRRDHSRSLSRDRLFRSRSRERSHERSSRKKRKIRDRSRERSWERDRSWNRSRESSESLDLEEIYGDSEKSWSGSPYRRKESPRRRHDSVESVSSIEKEDLHPTSQTLMGSILKQETGEFTAAEFSAKRKAEKNKTVSHEPETKKSKTEVLPKKKKVKPKPEVAKTKVPLPKLPVKLPRTPPKEGSRAESPIIILEDKEEEKSSESDDEPEETEQFSYTDRDEFLLQNKHKQQHTNLIQVVHTQEKPKEPASPAPPPGPDVREGHTPPVPVIGEPPFIGNQFPPPPPGPPPGMMIAPERPPVHVQASGPPGQSILSDGAILIRGLPPHSEPVPAGPQIIQNGSNLPGVSIGINVLPPGFPQGLPQPLRPQRPILVNAFMNQPPPGFPRLPGSPGPVQHIIQNPISSQIPSPGAQIPGPQVVGGPFDGLPPEGPPNMPPPGFPPGEPHHIVQIQTEGPPHNLLPLQHELEGLPLGPPPGSLPLPGPPEPQLIQITSNPHDPRLPIPLHLPPPSPEPPQHSVIVSGAPPAPVITSITPLQDEILSASIQGTTEESLHEINPSVRVETPPNSMAPVHIVKTPPPTASSIPGLGDLDSLPSVSGVPVDAGVKTTSKTMKDELPILSQLEEISKLLNVQAKLKIMSSQEKRKGNSPNSKNEDGVFKVPLPPGQKSGNNVTKEINEVTDMDMGSPIDEEGNIELPVSPQYENLIDKPEDLVDDIFSKKTGDDIFSKKTEDDIFAEKMGDDIFAKKTGDDIFPETRGDNVFSNKMGDDISTKKTDKKEDVAGDIFSEKTDKREAEGDNFSKKTDKNESVLDIFSNTSDKEDDSELEDIQDSFENKLDAIGLLKDIESLTRAINAETLAKKESDLNAVKDSEKTHKKDSHAKKKDEKSKHAKENRHKHHGSHRHHHKHKTGEEKVKTKDLRLKALTDAHLEIDSQEMPSSAVEMTNKEKYLQKLHLQERVVEEVKMAIKPHYASKDITKDQYKEILRKAVPKICHSKSGDINPMKIKSLIEAYVSKFNKSSSDKDSVKSNEVSPSVKANGERVKQKTNR